MNTVLAVVLAAVLLAPGAAAAPAAPQTKAPDLVGKWKTLSLTQNRIGYEMNLTAAGTAGDAYQGRLQFRHRDGRRTTSVNVGLAVGKASKESFRVTIVMPGGALATGKGTIAGRLSRTDGSMYFPKCSDVLPFAMDGEEDTDCLFREMPNEPASLP